jgi:hypothetical protein
MCGGVHQKSAAIGGQGCCKADGNIFAYCMPVVELVERTALMARALLPPHRFLHFG